MAGVPASLAIWLVVSLWVVDGVACILGYRSELVWFVLFLGTGVALAEWDFQSRTR